VPLSNFVPRGFGFVHHSIGILYHEVPNPNLTIRNFFIAVRLQGLLESKTGRENRLVAAKSHLTSPLHGPQSVVPRGGSADVLFAASTAPLPSPSPYAPTTPSVRMPAAASTRLPVRLPHGASLSPSSSSVPVRLSSQAAMQAMASAFAAPSTTPYADPPRPGYAAGSGPYEGGGGGGRYDAHSVSAYHPYGAGSGSPAHRGLGAEPSGLRRSTAATGSGAGVASSPSGTKSSFPYGAAASPSGTTQWRTPQSSFPYGAAASTGAKSSFPYGAAASPGGTTQWRTPQRDGRVGSSLDYEFSLAAAAPSDSDAALSNLLAMNQRLLSRLGEPAGQLSAAAGSSRPRVGWEASPAPRVGVGMMGMMGMGDELAAARAALDDEEAEARQPEQVGAASRRLLELKPTERERGRETAGWTQSGRGWKGPSLSTES
jgi:hypothetical protein